MSQDDTVRSIIFIGEYNGPMYSLESKIVGKELDKSITMPDVIKYQIKGCDCDAWVFIGDVKPTLLLKDLISKMELIIFVFNIEKEESLTFLDEGWGRIIEKVDKTANFKRENQQRLLIGTKSDMNSKSDQINEQIRNIVEKFHCSAYFEEINSQEYKLKISDKSSMIESDLIKHLETKIKQNQKQQTEANANTSKPNAQNRKKDEIDTSIQTKGVSQRANMNQGNNSKNIELAHIHPERQNMPNKSSNQEKDEKIKLIGPIKQSVNIKQQEKKDEKIKLIGSIKQNENIKQQEKNDEENTAKEEKENDDDEFVELEDIRNKKLNPFTDSNGIVYDLFDVSQTANTIKLAVKHKSNATVPQFINCYSKRFIVTRIRDNSFSSPTIKSLSFAENSRVQSIGNYAFRDSSLEYLFIPSSLKRIDDYTFYGANSLKAIEVDNKNRYFSAQGGLLIFNKEPNERNTRGEVVFAFQNFDGSFKYNNNVTQYKFNRSTNSLTFTSNSSNQLILSSESFKYYSKCQNILNVVISSSRLVVISINFFEDSYVETFKVESPDLRIGKLSFKHCINLKSIYLISKTVVISERSFIGCESLTSIDIESQSKIDLHGQCFRGNESLQAFRAKSNEINIGDCCFTNCSSLSSITITNAKSMKIGENAFTSCQSLENLKICILSNIEMGNYCFSQSSKLKLIEIGGITKLRVSEGCFENCKSLSTISLPDCHEVSFLNNSLSGCNKLAKILLNPESSASFYDLCFGETKIKSPFEIQCSEISISIKDLTTNPIKTLNNVKSISIKSDKNIDRFEFIDKYSTLESISLEIESEQEITFDLKKISKFTSLKTFNMNTKSVLNIKSESFSKLNNLESIDITSGVLIIEKNNFNRQTKLREVTMRSHQIQIHTNCFNELIKLENVIFQSEKLEIDEKCFNKCQQFSTIFLRNANYVKIGTNTFSECPNLNEFNINSNGMSASDYFTIISSKTTSNKTSFAQEKSSKKVFHYKSLPNQIRNKNEFSEFFKKILQISSTGNQSVLPIYCLTFFNFESEPHPTIFTEYIKGKSLEAALNEGKLTNTQRYVILVGITYGMKYLHSKRIIHSSLTPSNIILDEKPYPHINDFMNSSKITKPPKITKYTAPEIFNSEFYSFANDIYSYSIIAYELLTGERPFEQYNSSQIVNSVIKGGKRPELSHIANERIKTFFERCWSRDAKSRPTIDEIYDEVTTSAFLDEFESDIIETNVYLNKYRIEIKRELPKTSKMTNKTSNSVFVEPPKSNDAKGITKNNSSILSPKSIEMKKETRNNPRISSNDMRNKITNNASISSQKSNDMIIETSNVSSVASPQSNDAKIRTANSTSVSSPRTKSSLNDTKNTASQNKLIIRRYLKTKLFTGDNNLYVYDINDKTKIGGNLQNLTSKISQAKEPDFLYYTINYYNYTVEFFDIGQRVQDLPKYLNMQMKPQKSNARDIRICILCDESRIQRRSFDEDLYSIVIEFYNNDSIYSIKNRIIQYLNPNSKKYNNPNIYTFDNNGFNLFVNIRKSRSKTDPLFVSWETYYYKELKEYILQHRTKKNEIC